MTQRLGLDIMSSTCSNVIFLLALLVLTKPRLNCAEIQCVNESGSPVDWIIIYKLPKAKEKKEKDKNALGDGTSYVYIDSQTKKSEWKLSSLKITDSDSIAGRILSPLYDKSDFKKLLFLLFNDQQPGGKTNGKKGHTKGVLAFDEKTGFWLVHSVPKFPQNPEKGKYTYPETGTKFGQTFLCISLKTSSSADLLGTHLQFYQPFIYSKHAPEWVTTQKFPNMLKIINGKFAKEDETFRVTNLTTLEGTKISAFAKLPDFGKDLYSGLVAPTLDVNLRVESWQNGDDDINSVCNKEHRILNIDQINFNNVSGHSLQFSSSKDHSKWAISFKAKKFVCIGDINRMESQKKRAGGTLCLKDPQAWLAFNSTISNVKPCT